MTSAAVRFELDDGIATVTLDLPDRMNPLTPALQQGLRAALQRIREDKAVRAMLLTARGRGFCVGPISRTCGDGSRRAKANRSAPTSAG